MIAYIQQTIYALKDNPQIGMLSSALAIVVSNGIDWLQALSTIVLIAVGVITMHSKYLDGKKTKLEIKRLEGLADKEQNAKDNGTPPQN